MKHTKKALLTSILSVLLCLAMLVSATFAWFSDSASTSVNSIRSGTLEVALEMKNADGSWESAEGKTLSFKKAAGAPEDERILWEPGCTYELPELRIRNNGRLALKYKLIITGIVGDAKLLEAIEFTYGEGIDINAEVGLAPGGSTGGIIIRGHMKDTAGNAYQGLSISGISVCVVATQDDVEYDSTGNDYDASAEYPELPGMIDESASFIITHDEGGGVIIGEDEIQVPREAVEEDTEAVFSIKRTDYTEESVTYEISLAGTDGSPIELAQPATVTVAIGQNLDVVSVFHGETEMIKDINKEALTDQEYYYSALEGKLYLCTATFSPFTVRFAAQDIGESENENLNIHALYLSDIPYVDSMTVPASTSAAWGNITMDKTADTGAPLSLRVNGEVVTFRKGIFAHAKSTIVYDLSEYSDYDFFSTYYGVSSLRGSNGSVKFYIYTSADGVTWDLKTPESPAVMSGASDAGRITIPLEGVKYIKLYADPDGSNGQDHSIYGDAKLYKEGYTENVTTPVEEFDEGITDLYDGEITEELELTLLQREFVKRAGDYTLRTFVEEDGKNQAVLDWLMNDQELLRLYLVGGKPEGSYLKSLEVLSSLYYAHGNDLNIDTVTAYGTRLGDLYRTMMLAISLTHSGTVYLWVDGDLLSDPVERYEIYKDLHSQELIQTSIFESLTVEEMRWVMNTVIDDEEIKWLNWYVRENGGKTSPYSYIRYTFGYNYTLDKYYSQENYEMWEAKYNLSDTDWNITYQAGYPKLWIVFEEGSVCGGLSKTGSCIWGSYMGLPNTCVSQPGHCAYIYYTRNNGNGVWNLGNDVSGWAQSGKTEHLNVRIMNDWGSTTPGWTAPYVLLAQAAQNEYDKYEKSEITLMLADVYKDDPVKLEAIYEKALSEENINFDAWTGLVNLYLSDSNRTEEEYYRLAERIANALTFYPRPMNDLISRLEPKLTSAAWKSKFTMMKTRVLTTAANATDAQTIQKTAVRQVAQGLLGAHDGTVATFSFDGDNAGRIVLGSKFGDNDVTWDYSLDGGTTWTQSTEKAHQLTEAELASITPENDIKVHIIGVDYSEDNIYSIDIKASAGIPSMVYANDRENRFIAATDAMEWRFTEDESWTSFAVSQPDLTGDKTVMVRVAPTGVYQVSAAVTYTFTADSDPAEKTYIPISELSIHSFSSETNPATDRYKRDERAVNAIDGNINTMWHNLHDGTDNERYIVIKLSEPMYVSALEYQPKPNYKYGIIKNGVVSVSMDGENWTEAARITDWANNTTAKTVTFSESVQAQYVKLQVIDAYDSYFVNAAMINLFQDATKTNSGAGEAVIGAALLPAAEAKARYGTRLMILSTER